MRVLVAAASFSSELSGVQRHAFNVLRSLLTRPEILSVHLVVAPWQRELVRESGLESNPQLTVHAAQMKPGSLSRNRWYYWQLPVLATQLGADVVHLAYPVPVDAHAFACPTVVTLHDLYPYEIPSNFGFPKAIINRLILQRCLRSVNAIACVSEVTLCRLSRYVPQLTLKKALRIYNCVEAELLCTTQRPIYGWEGEPFLLCVAQHRRNKNIPFLLHVFKRLMHHEQIDSAMRLIIVGIPGPETRHIRRLITRYALRQKVLLLKGLAEAELQWCYRNCEVVLAPSKLEGFGLPVVEALLAGCRVICSDIPAFRELGSDHCRFVRLDGRAEDKFAEAIVAALQGPRSEPISMPLLSASVIAEQYVHLYRELLASAEEAKKHRFSASVKTALLER